MAIAANTDCIFSRDLYLPQEQEHITEWVMQRHQEPSGCTATVVQGAHLPLILKSCSETIEKRQIKTGTQTMSVTHRQHRPNDRVVNWDQSISWFPYRAPCSALCVVLMLTSPQKSQETPTPTWFWSHRTPATTVTMQCYRLQSLWQSSLELRRKGKNYQLSAVWLQTPTYYVIKTE